MSLREECATHGYFIPTSFKKPKPQNHHQRNKTQLKQATSDGTGLQSQLLGSLRQGINILGPAWTMSSQNEK